jgi:transposase
MLVGLQGWGCVTRCLPAYMLVDNGRNDALTVRSEDLVDVSGLELRSERIGALPLINVVYDRLGIDGLLERYVPVDDARLRVAPAVALGVVIRNLVIRREPVYGLGRWAAGFDPALLGLSGMAAEALNDDRVGRVLGRLFDADRASLLTRLVLDAIEVYDIDTSRLHNDSTSITFSGAYEQADGRARGGKPTPAIVRGHNKDGRPELKQLVWILTVSADGAVPIAHRVVDGNTNDDTTHIDTWDGLAALTGRTDFLYVADSKLATRANMDHIHRAEGRFVAVLPASRREDRTFRDWIVENDPTWTFAMRRSSRYADAPDDLWHTTPAPWPSAEGYRIVWVRSSAKIERDAKTRHNRIAKAIAAIDTINQRLASPRCRMKTITAVEQTVKAELAQLNATRWVHFTVTEDTEETFRQEKRGRPGDNTRYRKIVRTHRRVRFEVDETQVAHDAASDGMWPLITNDRTLSDAEVLAAYKWQPNLEKRHAQLKGTHHVAPMWLRDPARIEGLLACEFIALLVSALIERALRHAMHQRDIPNLAVYPEDRTCTAPTTARIIDLFEHVARHHLTTPDGTVLRTFAPELTDLQHQILDLLDIPTAVYTTTSLGG